MKSLLRLWPGKDRTAPPLSAGQAFARRYQAHLNALGLEAGTTGFSLRQTQAFQDRGVETELVAVVQMPYDPVVLAAPAMRRGENARAWLTGLRDNLAREAAVSIDRAGQAIRTLIDQILNPGTQSYIDEDTARRTYLSLPASIPVSDAETGARRHLRDLKSRIEKARLARLAVRVRSLPSARLHGKTLSVRYPAPVSFLSVSLELELNVEVRLSDRSAAHLSEVSDEQFPAAVEVLTAGSRKALLLKLGDQLSELTRRIRTLSHIELLSDADIAAVVAPYYGGINRDLKKRRARSALVAVEERAREAKYQVDVTKLNEKRAAYADVAAYYPVARLIRRRMILYVGPTNSGKTWRALNDLAQHDCGAYLAPLRLLALEGQEELEKRGKPTSFVTGEERDIRPDARFVSSTIEMLNIEIPVDAVVVDEVQMLADERRGWAWLAAVVGAPAQKIIMTGSPDCVELVSDLAAYLGEELEIVRCERYNELRVATAPMRLRDIRPGMAVVCFSRRDVQRIKNLIQENSKFKVAVVYGNLSPQVRREEARRFRSGEAEILVATDAIAMGLNLPISEVLFNSTERFNGEEIVPLPTSDIRQIGGRAGRYGFAQYGVVNALDEDSLERIRAALTETPETLKPPFFIAPGPNHIRIIGDVLGSTSLERILTFFERAIEFSDDRFARSNIDDLSFLSTYVDERLPFMPPTERLTVAAAPVGIRNETVVRWFLDRMLTCFPDPADPDRPLDQLDDLFASATRFDRDTARSQLDLRDAEDYLKTLTVYAWMAYRYPSVFPRIDECEMAREMVNGFVERSLRSAVTREREPRGGGKRGRGRGRRKGR